MLRGIASLRYPLFELIVVFDPGDPATAQCLARHAIGAKLGHCAAANLAAARNIGLSLAAGDIAAFIDDDSVPEPDWLDQLNLGFAQPGTTAAGGAIRAQNGIAFQSRIVLIDAYGADHHREQLPPSLPAGFFPGLTGTNFAVHRTAALAIGGFDENFSYFLEETDFLRRLGDDGGIRLIEAAEVHHGLAGGGMRTQGGAPNAVQTIARSKAYFCHVNRRPGTKFSDINSALKRFLAGKYWLIASSLLTARLNIGSASRLFRELHSGIREGEALAKGPRSLADFAAPPPFSRQPRQSPRHRLCILMKTRPRKSPQWERIRELARSNYEVTIIWFGAGLLPAVHFADGVWQHRLSAGTRLPWRTASAIAAELDRISDRRKFENIHVASRDPALQKAAAASGLAPFTPPSVPASPDFPE